MTSVSIQRAAEILGVSEKTIHRHRRRGVLSAADAARAAGVVLDEVAALKRALDERRDAVSDGESRHVSPASVSSLMPITAELATNLVKLRRTMGLGPPAPPLSEPELLALAHFMSTTPDATWSPHAEPWLAGAVLALRPKDLDRLADAATAPHLLRRLIVLAATLAVASYDPSLRLAFGAARAHVACLASLWCAARGEGPRDIGVMLRRAKPQGQVVRRRRCEERQHRSLAGGAGMECAEGAC